MTFKTSELYNKFQIVFIFKNEIECGNDHYQIVEKNVKILYKEMLLQE